MSLGDYLFLAFYTSAGIYIPIWSFSFVTAQKRFRGELNGKKVELETEIGECYAWFRSLLIAIIWFPYVMYSNSAIMMDGQTSTMVYVRHWPITMLIFYLCYHSIDILFQAHSKKKELKEMTELYK